MATRRSASRQHAAPKVGILPTTGQDGSTAGGSQTDRIVNAITDAIVERRLMPGTKLAEQKLADIFQVSRTLVRQALNQLCRDRLVTLEPARGAFVATPSIEEAREVFEMRTLLETAMVRALCQRIAAPQIAALQAHLKDEAHAVARQDVPGRTRLLADFHIVLARQYGNAVIEATLADLLRRSQLISLMYQSAHSAEASHQEHVAVVQAIANKDARAAAKLMTHHLDSVERNLRLHPRGTDLHAALRPEA